MEVWDSPNSVGVVIDAVRCCKLALERGLGGHAGGAGGLLDEVAADAA
jgi:myo-inositol-1-phosphate synthase